MKGLLSLSQGRKTYAVVAVGLTLGVIQGLNACHIANIQIPDWIDWALMFAGLGATRNGIQTQAKNTTENVVALVEAVLAQIEVPAPQTITVAGRAIQIGKPSGTLSPVEETAETAALNTSQAAQ